MLKKCKLYIVLFSVFAYGLLSLGGSGLALAIAPLFAGPHAVSVVSDGTHVDIVFGHDYLTPHHHDHAVVHSHSKSHHHHHHEHKKRASIEHPQSHPDHVFHLSTSKQEPTLMSEVFPVYEGIGTHIKIPPTVTLVPEFFVNSKPIQLFANPPPSPRQDLQFLRTIVLLI